MEFFWRWEFVGRVVHIYKYPVEASSDTASMCRFVITYCDETPVRVAACYGSRLRQNKHLLTRITFIPGI